MYKNFFCLFIFTFTSFSYGQSIDEILNLIRDNPIGTARYQSMGGAFGALGGDLSAININPASSSVFNDNQYGFTLATEKKANKSLYFNNTENQNENKFSINQGGAVWLFKNSGDGNINKISFGFNAQTNNSFQNSISIKGRNSSNSIDKFFVNNSLGFNLNDLSVGDNENISGVYKYLGEFYGYSAQQAFLAYQSYLLDYDQDSNTFFSIAKYNNGVDQNYKMESNGVNTKYNFNVALQLKKDFYFGLNINTHNVFIDNYVKYTENNFDSDSAIKSINFENSLLTKGEGFSIQLGAIAKIKSIRLGLAYQSPTWYTMQDETYQFLEVNSQDVNGVNFKDIIDPRVLNVYPKYDLRTPSSITTSAAFIFGKIGLLSIDIVSRDYSKVKLKPNYEFLSLNKEIASKLTNTQDIRLGTEFRINKLSLRGGFTKVGSPYSDSKMMKDSYSYSFGMGFDFGETLVNFSYKTLSSETNKQLFDSGLTDSAKLNTKQSISSLSIIFKF
jgi:hypothetical protein